MQSVYNALEARGATRFGFDTVFVAFQLLKAIDRIAIVLCRNHRKSVASNKIC